MKLRPPFKMTDVQPPTLRRTIIGATVNMPAAKPKPKAGKIRKRKAKAK